MRASVLKSRSRSSRHRSDNSMGSFAERLRGAFTNLPARSIALLRDHGHWFAIFALLIVLGITPAYWSRALWFSPDSMLIFQPLVPILAAVSIWHWRADFKEIYAETALFPEDSPQRRGKMWLMLLGCILMLAAYATQAPGFSILAWVVLAIGIIYYAFGRTIMKYLLPEMLFVLAMIPIPATLITETQRTVQLAMASVGGDVLRGLKNDVLVQNNFIYFARSAADAAANNYSKAAFAVLPEVSGLTIAIPLIALTVWLTIYKRYRTNSALMLVALASALGFIIALSRVVLLGLLASAKGADTVKIWAYGSPQVFGSQLVASPWFYILPSFALIWFVANRLRLR